MSDDKTRAADDRPQASETQQQPASASEELQAQLDEAQSEAEQQREQLMRARAELENVRKRAERDVEAARKFALEKFATELLGVRDSLEMGLQATQEKAGDYDSLKEGMELTERMLRSSMEKFGIEAIDPSGETFNPEFHEAMTTQETGDQPPNTVLSVLQKGYLLNGRVLRPAMVVVSKAPSDEQSGGER